MTNNSVITPELSIYDFLYLDTQIVSTDMAEMLGLPVSRIQKGMTSSIQVFVAGLLVYHEKKGTQAVIGILQRGSVLELSQFDDIASSMQVASDKGNALGYLLFGTVNFMSASQQIGLDTDCNHEQAKRLLACTTNLCLRQLAIMFTQLQSSYTDLDDWLGQQLPLLSKTSRNIPVFSALWLEFFELVEVSEERSVEEAMYLTATDNLHHENIAPSYFKSDNSAFVIEYGTPRPFWKNPIILLFLAIVSGVLGLGTVKAIQSNHDNIQADEKENHNILSELSRGDTVAKIGKDNMLSSKDSLNSKLVGDNNKSTFSDVINENKLTTNNKVDIQKPSREQSTTEPKKPEVQQSQDIAIIRVKDDGKASVNDNNNNKNDITDKQIEQALAKNNTKETASNKEQVKLARDTTIDASKTKSASKITAKHIDNKKVVEKKTVVKAQKTNQSNQSNQPKKSTKVNVKSNANAKAKTQSKITAKTKAAIKKTETTKVSSKKPSTTRKKLPAKAKSPVKKAAIKTKASSKVQTKNNQVKNATTKTTKGAKKTQTKAKSSTSNKSKKTRTTPKKITAKAKPPIKKAAIKAKASSKVQTKNNSVKKSQAKKPTTSKTSRKPNAGKTSKRVKSSKKPTNTVKKSTAQANKKTQSKLKAKSSITPKNKTKSTAQATKKNTTAKKTAIKKTTIKKTAKKIEAKTRASKSSKVKSSKANPAVQKKPPIKKKSTEVNLSKEQIQKLIGEIENPQ